MKCKNCNGKIPYHYWRDGKLKITSHTRTLCFTCSPWQYKSTEQDKITCEKTCLRCKKKLQNNRRNYCHSCNVIRSRQHRKQVLVELAGGKCKVCGYERYIGNLVFHHMDPSIKEFPITAALSKPMEMLKQEIQKCTLLCCRCHGELHGGIITVS